MTRKNGPLMTNILAIHSEWLVANGYLTKHKRLATTYKRNHQKKKYKRGTSGLTLAARTF